MEEKDLFRKINKESENNVPDAYGKIVQAARAQGLFDGYDGAEAYSDGETVALGGVNKKAVALTTLAAVTAVCLAIALPIALSGTYNGLDSIDDGNKVVADIDLGDDYAIGAVTCARLAESFLDEPSGAKAMAVTADDFSEFGVYFTALDCLLNGNGVQTSLGTPAEYKNTIVLSGHRNNGDLFDYQMRYTEYKRVSASYVTGNPVNYYLEGIIIAGWNSGLYVVGERTMSSDAADAEETALKLCAYPDLNDKSTYARMQLITEDVGGIRVKSYFYEIVKDDAAVSEAVAYKPVDADLVIKIKDGEEDKGKFTVLGKDDAGTGYKVNYELGVNVGEITVKTTGNGLSYEFPDPSEENSLLGYRDNGDGTYSVTTYDKTAALPETLVIPATYKGKPVVSVGEEAFMEAPIKKLVISEGIKKIEEEAFAVCRYLTDLTLPSTLTEIGVRAFYACLSLPSVTLPQNLTRIGLQGFSGCSKIEFIKFNDNLTVLDDLAFERCTSLSSVNLPASLVTLEPRAFADCSNLAAISVDEDNQYHYSDGNCVIQAGGTHLEIGIKTSVIPSGILNIGNYAFYHVGLTQLQLPSSVLGIGACAFEGNDFSLFVLPDDVRFIDINAFKECVNLVIPVLPANLEMLGVGVFEKCVSLESVEIPAKVSHIETMVFAGCKNLTSLTVDAANAVYHSKDNCIIDTENKVLVAGCKTSVIPDDGSVQTIGASAFMYCTFTDITIPAAVTKLEQDAFANCTELTEVAMEGVTDIGFGTFQCCTYLQTVAFPNGLKKIGDWAFQSCDALVNVTLPEGLTAIGEGAFHACKTLESVKLPSTLSDVGSQVFKDCKALKSVVVADGVTHVYPQMFYGCEQLTTVNLPKTISDIDFQAFYGCGNGTVAIYYDGAKADWAAIVTGEGWDFNFSYVVFCTDGELE